MTHEIKPCPFCGSKAYVETLTTKGGSGWCSRVRCRKCGFYKEVTPCQLHGSTKEELKLSALERWNTRTNENESLHARIKELEEIAKAGNEFQCKMFEALSFLVGKPGGKTINADDIVDAANKIKELSNDK